MTLHTSHSTFHTLLLTLQTLHFYLTFSTLHRKQNPCHGKCVWTSVSLTYVWAFGFVGFILFFLRVELLMKLRACFSDLIFQTCPRHAVRSADKHRSLPSVSNCLVHFFRPNLKTHWFMRVHARPASILSTHMRRTLLQWLQCVYFSTTVATRLPRWCENWPWTFPRNSNFLN